jgi:hypothetical protein
MRQIKTFPGNVKKILLKIFWMALSVLIHLDPMMKPRLPPRGKTGKHGSRAIPGERMIEEMERKSHPMAEMPAQIPRMAQGNDFPDVSNRLQKCLRPASDS